MSDPSKPVAGDAASSAGSVVKDAAATASKTAETAKKALPEQNPALRMMGLPRFRLPSRNWMIFWTLTGSLASAIVYDKWQTKRVKDKWCKVVSHIADEPLDIRSLPRTMTIYLSAPPGDGLRSAREHFHNYVKPVLVAAAIDWDVVEGRKEGDVRFKTAERIRRRRRAGGEGTPVAPEDHTVESIRQNLGVTEYKGAAGDLVIGRHTWKEYIRGMHEGWLGPTETPAHVDAVMGNLPEPVTPSTTEVAKVEEQADAVSTTADADAMVTSLGAVTAEENAEEKSKPDTIVEEKKEEEEKPKPRQPPPYILPEAYSTAVASRLLPEVIGPSAPIPCPHILGFRNTPIRFYRFLTRRYLADDIGRQVATAVLGASRTFDTVTLSDDSSPSGDSHQPEQTEALVHEERNWHKSVRQPRKEFEESILVEPMVFDERITSRMRKFELTAEEAQRANAIAAGDAVDKA